ncbi:amino acid adenylation domain-containing protein [Nitrospira sp. Nam80]
MLEQKKRAADRPQLSAVKKALLQKLLEGKGGDSADPDRICRRSHPHDPAPLSFAQQRLWFLNQLEPNSHFYNVPVAFGISGALNIAALQQSIDAVLLRHEALRSIFTEVDGQPVQSAMPYSPLPIKHVDLRALADQARERELQRFLTQEFQDPFNLAKGPLFRSMLLRLEDRRYVLFITMHHIVTDDWSMGIFFRELAASYRSFADGTPIVLPDDGVQYADYAAWQRQRLSAPMLEKQLAYWKDKLRGVPTFLKLPTDRPRPSVQTYKGDEIRFTLTEAFTAQLNEFSRKQGVTLFMTLLAAFEVLLYRYSNQEQFCIGTPLANRTRPEIEGLIGVFINTLVLRADLSGDLTLLEHLAAVRETALEAQSHQDVPFEKLLDELQPARDLAHSPLFQVLFVLHNVPRRSIEISGLQFYPVGMEEKSARFDLCLDMTEMEGQLSGLFQYSTDLFEAETITRLVRHYRLVLAQLLGAPETRLSEVELLTEAERHCAVVDWNATAAAYPDDRCVQQLVDEQADRTPEAVAVRDAEQALTYRELQGRAARVADALVAAGVGPEACVGLCVERSVAMVVGLLGILKAGAAYVPLDPRYPTERLALMMEDARVAGLVTQRALTDRLPACGAPVLYVHPDGTLPADPPPARRPAAGHSAQTAYVIYTSGSTGRPKGVMIAHRSVVNFLWAMQALLGLSARDRVVAVTSLSFDIAVLEVFLPLMVGAEMALAEAETASDGTKLMHWVEATHPTVMQATPATWRMLLEAGWQGLAGGTLLCGGEALAPDLAARLGRAGTALWNVYGPTETTVWSAAQRIDNAAGPILIGRPLANTDLYVLDRRLQLVPVGVVGELYIGGAGLATGYWGRPDLTAERFVPHPFRDDGTRLYRTGDLGRRRADGTLECLGRVDQQVKLRGYRIEPGEIEARLVEYPPITHAVVVVREEPAGPKRLVGYLVASEPVAASELREFLRRRLPEYMIPATFVVLDKLPLTPNGKVDRKALPAPEEGRGEARPYAAPRTELEATLAAVWRDVLGAARVGIHDNFFELGGDSILIIQAISRARQQGIELTPRQLFQHQTVAALAAVSTGSAAKAERAGSAQGAVPLTPIQQDFFAQSLPNPHYYNQAVLLEVQPGVDLRRLEAAVRTVLAHHDAFRLRFTPEADGWRQAYAVEATVAVERVDLATVAAAAQSQALEAAATEWQGRLNLTTGPVARAVLFTRGPEQTARLLLVVHHLVVDDISWRILLDDLMTAYQGLATQETVRLPATNSFQAWAAHLQAYSQAAALQAEAPYWLGADQEAAPFFPVEEPEGAATEADADIVTVSVDAETTRQLVQDVPAAARIQIHEVLIAVLVHVLSRWSESAVVQLDLERHGRDELFPAIDVSRTVGWFTTVFPVMVRVVPGAAPGAVLAAVKDQLRRIPHKGIGYGLLRYGCGDPEVRQRLAARPPSPVRFNYLGQVDQTFPAEAPVRPAPESGGANRDARNRLPYELDINANILDGRLHLLWGYSGRRYRRATMEVLGEQYAQMLRTLVAHCLAGEAAGYTPADFPDVELSPDLLDHILEEIQ